MDKGIFSWSVWKMNWWGSSTSMWKTPREALQALRLNSAAEREQWSSRNWGRLVGFAAVEEWFCSRGMRHPSPYRGCGARLGGLGDSTVVRLDLAIAALPDRFDRGEDDDRHSTARYSSTARGDRRDNRVSWGMAWSDSRAKIRTQKGASCRAGGLRARRRESWNY